MENFLIQTMHKKILKILNTLVFIFIFLIPLRSSLYAYAQDSSSAINFTPSEKISCEVNGKDKNGEAGLMPSSAYAPINNSLTGFNKDDRVLVLAPHPDDEAIGAAGAIQQALKAGAKVKVVCYTNGDHNQLAFIVYEKRLTIRKGEFLHMGEVRRKETIKAMASLGLSSDNIVFLGYPDFGTMSILTKYWGQMRPFKSLLTRMTSVPYKECLSPGAPYSGESILKDLKTVILDFKPTKIFVSHPADTNRDHRSLYLFLRIALWDLEDNIQWPAVYPYIIHVVGWPKPRGYHPELELEPSGNFKDILWQKLALSAEEIKAKHDAISVYKSQIESNPPYLFTFARKNELFGDYLPVSLKKQEEGEIRWQDLDVGDDNAAEPMDREEYQKGRISALAYAYQNGNLFIRLIPKRKIDKEFGMYIYLFGYSKKTDFAQMPKIYLAVDIGGLHIKDKKQTLFIKDVQMHYEGKAVVIKVPLTTLGNPAYILSCAKTRSGDLSLDDIAWRILELK